MITSKRHTQGNLFFQLTCVNLNSALLQFSKSAIFKHLQYVLWHGWANSGPRAKYGPPQRFTK